MQRRTARGDSLGLMSSPERSKGLLPVGGLVGAIGNTPLVQLDRLSGPSGPRLLAKLEWCNPSGSVKDRIAASMIAAAVSDGRLQPGGTIIESSSGNTGIGLSALAAAGGFQAVIICTQKVAPEKLDVLRGLGTKVVMVDAKAPLGSPGHFLEVGARLQRETPGSLFFDQYSNPANPAAHYGTTGPEIWRQSGGKLDVFVAGAGTGGTISGVGKFLKERDPNIEVVLADPVGSIYGHYVQTGEIAEPGSYEVEAVGQGEAKIPRIFDRSVIDRVLSIPDAESFATVRLAAKTEGLMCGSSSGLALAGALRVARAHTNDGARVVVLLPDSAERYATANAERAQRDA